MGGTINEDDHRFGLSAAKKYGGIFVPPHMAVIHQYMRERFAGCGTGQLPGMARIFSGVDGIIGLAPPGPGGSGSDPVSYTHLSARAAGW